MKIKSSDILRAVGDETWRAIDKSIQADATVNDVITAVMMVHLSIATERRFGNWCEKIRDIYLGYLDGLSLRLQEIDNGEIAHTMAAAGVIKLAREGLQ